MKYVKGLDTLRALAVLFVIIDHWGPFFPEHTTKQYIKIAFVEDGSFGVNLFFVLSGFLITGILLNEKIKNQAGNHLVTIKNFFIRRSLRIFPIYYLFIAVCFAINYHDIRSEILYYATYTSNILSYKTNSVITLAHTWSLSVEEQFYLIWPWVILYANWKYIKPILITSIAVGVISKFIAVFVLHYTYPVLVFNCFDSFGIGALYAYIRLDEEKCRKFERSFMIVFPLLIFIAWRISTFGGNAVGITYKNLLNNLIQLALIMFVLKNKSEWMRKHILENTFFNFIGRISYGIYLYHYVLGNVINDAIANYTKTHPQAPLPVVLTNFYSIYCIKLVLLILISWLSFNWIEKPILTLKKKFEYSAA